MWEGIPVKRLTPKRYLKSFLDVSDSYKTSASLSVWAYFRQFSDWYETYFGHSQESPGVERLMGPNRNNMENYGELQSEARNMKLALWVPGENLSFGLLPERWKFRWITEQLFAKNEICSILKK